MDIHPEPHIMTAVLNDGLHLLTGEEVRSGKQQLFDSIAQSTWKVPPQGEAGPPNGLLYLERVDHSQLNLNSKASGLT